MKNLEILVVEDNEKNRKAAEEYFNSRDDVNVNFVASYKAGLEKLQQEKYDFAILDLEFPREEGAKPEKLGLELGRELDVVRGKYRVPHVFLTGAFRHGTKILSQLFIDEFYVERNDGKIVHGKNGQKAWEDAYEKLVEICPNIAKIQAAKERVLKFTGKPYIKIKK